MSNPFENKDLQAAKIQVVLSYVDFNVARRTGKYLLNSLLDKIEAVHGIHIEGATKFKMEVISGLGVLLTIESNWIRPTRR